MQSIPNRALFTGDNQPIDFFSPHPQAIAVVCQANHMLSIEFDNGECGLLDMNPYLNVGVFKELRDPAVFQSARAISFGAIIWDDGGIDLDPAFVYGKTAITSHSKNT